MKRVFMKKEYLLIRATFRAATFAILILFVGSLAASAQVTPRVCVETTYQTGTTTLAQAAVAGTKLITVNGYVPPLVSIVINPGGTTEERFTYINVRIDGTGPYTLNVKNSYNEALRSTSFNGATDYTALAYAHAEGETVTFAGYSGTASFGYRNAGSSAVNIPRSITSYNFFTPGPSSYTGQPSSFQPGIYENVVNVPFGGQAGDTLTWVLTNTSNPAVARNDQSPCGSITYQGRLTDGSGAANGQYDLRFVAYDALTGGKAQSGVVTIENAQVTNGVFTVQLNFHSSFNDNFNAKFLEIAVRPGASSGSDPFTVLTSRQPITFVPHAVNAQTARKAFDVQMLLTTGTPSSNECAMAGQYGQTRVDAVNLKLYICTAAGWKSTLLQ
ncbi:MAG TPA: hypothetical protein VF596_04580 [Pyrinomonadaceae bacterium]